MRFRNGLSVGGRIRRDLAAVSINVPLLAMHRRNKTCWSWFVEFFRYRRSSGCRHRFFSVYRHIGAQSHVAIDFLWLGSLRFVWQVDWDALGAKPIA